MYWETERIQCLREVEVVSEDSVAESLCTLFHYVSGCAGMTTGVPVSSVPVLGLGTSTEIK